MRIAILGATSEIAKDFVSSICAQMDHELVLFARRPEAVQQWLAIVATQTICEVDGFDSFQRKGKFDAIVNFVGIGNPSRATELGSELVRFSNHFDQLALDHLKQYPDCRYVFLSSGAVYGSRFPKPVDDNSVAEIAINHLQPPDWYGVSKLLAECRHRSISQASIVDLRVFNYFSHSQSLSSRFLINDILRAIKDGSTLGTSSTNIVRDYLHPEDLNQLIGLVLKSPPANVALDCYSKVPVSKFDLLHAMREMFGLRYEVLNSQAPVSAAAEKLHYYSLSRRATRFGYLPRFSALECVLQQSAALLAI